MRLQSPLYMCCLYSEVKIVQELKKIEVEYKTTFTYLQSVTYHIISITQVIPQSFDLVSALLHSGLLEFGENLENSMAM